MPLQQNMTSMEQRSRKIARQLNALGELLVGAYHYLGLFVIGGVIAWASVEAFIHIVQQGTASVDEILILFIYLELGAMVGIYFKTNHLPIRFLIYVAITALTRFLIGDLSHHNPPDIGLIYLCGGIFLLALSIVAVRYASHRYPSDRSVEVQDKSEEAGDVR